MSGSKMIMSDEEKQWLVVGIAMSKVVAPVLHDTIKQGMDTQYINLDTKCRSLAPPCTLTTLQYSQVNTDAVLNKLKFKNINRNSLHGNSKRLYNYSIVSPVDLAKLYLPDYLAKFTVFDESLDMSAILQLLGLSSPTLLFPSPNPTLPIQPAADDVRDNVRNPWAHCDFTSWTEAFYNDCFTKLETLIRSVGLSAGVEKTTLDQLADWKTKGYQLVMGHAVDQSLVSLVQVEVGKLQKQLAEQVEALGEASEEIKVVQEKLISVEEKLMNRMQQLENGLTNVESKMKRGFVQTEENIQEVKTKVAKIETGHLITDTKVQNLEKEVLCLQKKPGACPLESFDVKSCQRKLAEYYKWKATVPTSLWSSLHQVDIHEIYTQLSWIREDHSATGSFHTELKDYTEIFRRNKKGLLPKRILVQGLTGMGKSTFVKKLAVDWAEFHLQKEVAGKGEKTEGESQWKSGEAKGISTPQIEFPGKFEIAVIVKLRDISHCKNLQEAIRESYLLPEEESAMIDGLLNYITANQEKVLIVFDGYDEYGCEDSEIYQIFKGSRLRNCTTLVTSRPSKADELKDFADVHTEIKGFHVQGIKRFMERLLSAKEARDLYNFLRARSLMDSARVPLLLLFYCLLWKEGKRDSFPETRTRLYLEIIKCLVNYSDRRKAEGSRCYSKLEDCEEILVELGKVAFEALLKDDLVFEFDQLSEAVQSKASLIIGVLEVQEYAENVRPAGKVSFIHKSLQEFLAAWYISHQCIPQGCLGRIEDAVQSVESCFAFENVLLFICGLSVEGARKIFELLKSVRISDPTVDLSKTCFSPGSAIPRYSYLPDENTILHDFALECLFEATDSREQLLGDCLNSVGGVVLVSDATAGAFSQVANLTQITETVDVIPYFLLMPRHLSASMIPECLNVPVSISESGEIVKLKDVWLKQGEYNWFKSHLTLTNGQIHFYITNIVCTEDDRIIPQIPLSRFNLYDSCSTSDGCTRGTVYRQAVQCSSPLVPTKRRVSESCFRFLEKVDLLEINQRVMEFVRAAISQSELRPELKLTGTCMSSTAVANLASLIPEFKAITDIDIFLLSDIDSDSESDIDIDFESDSDIERCNAQSVTTLLNSIVQKIVQLESLKLRNVDLISEAAVALGRCFHEMRELRDLCIVGNGNTLESADMEFAFGKFVKVLPLESLEFSDFRLGSSTAPLRDCFGFFPSLRYLELESLGIDEHGVTVLSEGFRHVPNLTWLSLSRNPLSHGLSSVMSQVRNLPMLQELCLSSVSCSEEDASCVAGSFKHMPNLESLDLSNNPLGHGVRLIVSQVKNLPKLRQLDLSNVSCSEGDVEYLSEGINSMMSRARELGRGYFLHLSDNPLGHKVKSLISSIVCFPEYGYLHLERTGCSEEDVNYVRELLRERGLNHVHVRSHSDCPFFLSSGFKIFL